jgi:propanediol dehydratase large subunit
MIPHHILVKKGDGENSKRPNSKITNGIVLKINCDNRNDPDLVQAFLKKWWVESDFKAPNLPLSLRFKGSGCED